MNDQKQPFTAMTDIEAETASYAAAKAMLDAGDLKTAQTIQELRTAITYAINARYALGDIYSAAVLMADVEAEATTSALADAFLEAGNMAAAKHMQELHDTITRGIDARCAIGKLVDPVYLSE